MPTNSVLEALQLQLRNTYVIFIDNYKLKLSSLIISTMLIYYTRHYSMPKRVITVSPCDLNLLIYLKWENWIKLFVEKSSSLQLKGNPEGQVENESHLIGNCFWLIWFKLRKNNFSLPVTWHFIFLKWPWPTKREIMFHLHKNSPFLLPSLIKVTVHLFSTKVLAPILQISVFSWICLHHTLLWLSFFFRILLYSQRAQTSFLGTE